MRIKFKDAKEQIDFFEEIKNKLSLNWVEFAKKLKVNKGTLYGWRTGRYTIPKTVFKKCINFINKIDLHEYKEVKEHWNNGKVAKKGGKINVIKNGNPGTKKGRRKGGKNSQRKRKENPDKYSHCKI